MSNRIAAAAMLAAVATGLSCGKPSKPETLFVPANAWTTATPSGATIVSSDQFRQEVTSGTLTLAGDGAAATAEAARDQAFRDDLGVLQGMATPPAFIQALLTEASGVTAFVDDPVVDIAGSPRTLVGLGNRVHLARRLVELSQSADNALSLYRTLFALLPATGQAGLPTPDSLSGKPVGDVKAALASLDAALAQGAGGPTAPVQPEVLAHPLWGAPVMAGNGSDNTGTCNPTGLERQLWFPLKRFMSPIKDQYHRGVCWAFAAIGALESQYQVQQDQVFDLSEQSLIYKVRREWSHDDYEEGFWSQDALNDAVDQNWSVPPEVEWTYDQAQGRVDGSKSGAAKFVGDCMGYSGTCSESAHEAPLVCTTSGSGTYCAFGMATFSGGGVKSTHVDTLWARDNLFWNWNLPTIRYALDSGHVVIADLPVYHGFMDGSDQVKPGVVSDYAQQHYDSKGNLVSGSAGGHAVQIVAFIPNSALTGTGVPSAGGGGYFVIKNSWGCGWGDQGYGYVPADYVEQRFDDLHLISFDSTRSARWTADNSSTRDGGEPPTIRVKLGALDSPLNVALDLGTNFTVSHISASAVSLTIASDKDGTIYGGSWNVTGFASTAPFTFTTLGVRTITVTASYGITSVQASFTVDVLDTPPDVTILAPNLSPWQNVAQTYTAQATDQNEPGGILPCSAITWSVDAPNVLSATTGCTVSITFASLGPADIRVTAVDPQNSSAQSTVTVNVVAQPVNPYPIISSAGVWGRATLRVGTTTSCIPVTTPDGTAIDLTAAGCGGAPFFAQATIDNPTSETLTYDWTLTVGSGAQTLLQALASTSTTFDLASPNNSGKTTAPCAVSLTVNAPDPSRSKGPVTVWSGTCSYYSFTVN